MKLSKIFSECAYGGNWTTINNVDFKFIEENDTLFIYWQGSRQGYDWKMNFTFTTKIYKMFRVHKGFYKEYSVVRNIILDKCYSKDYKKIVIVGYSLGGALATICHEDIKYHFPNKDIKTYAFESPRCLKVKKQYRFMWQNLYVIRNGCDLITHLPPAIFGYHHLGTMIKIKGDTKLVEKKVPKCIKYHYPQCVLNGLENLKEK